MHGKVLYGMDLILTDSGELFFSVAPRCDGGLYYKQMTDMKCGCVTGSTLMARFDLNHPYMLQNDSDELCCATMNALPS